MIRIEIYRGNAKIFEQEVTLKPGETDPLAVKADRELDRLLTEVHAGQHGPAPVRLVADFYSNTGQHFQGRHARYAVSALQGERTVPREFC